MSDLEALAAYHASDATVFTATVADAAERVPSVRVKRMSPTERRIAKLEAQVAELTRRLDESDGGK